MRFIPIIIQIIAAAALLISLIISESSKKPSMFSHISALVLLCSTLVNIYYMREEDKRWYAIVTAAYLAIFYSVLAIKSYAAIQKTPDAAGLSELKYEKGKPSGKHEILRLVSYIIAAFCMLLTLLIFSSFG